MCWNETVSLNTFFVGLFGVVLAGFNGYSPFDLLFYMSIVLMQLIEAFAWRNLSDPVANTFISKTAHALLQFQPIASILRMYPVDRSLTFKLIGAYLGFGALQRIYNTMNPVGTKIERFQMWQGENGHLVWNWLTKDNWRALSLINYFTFFILPFVLLKEYSLLVFILASIGISFWTFYKHDTWASMWCWLGNIAIMGIIAKIIFYDAYCMP